MVSKNSTLGNILLWGGATFATLVAGYNIATQTHMTSPELHYRNDGTAVVEGYGVSTFGYEWHDGEKTRVNLGEKVQIPEGRGVDEVYRQKLGRPPTSLEKTAIDLVNSHLRTESNYDNNKEFYSPQDKIRLPYEVKK